MRSSLPEEVSGKSSSTTMCAGTMYSGSHALNRCRTALILVLVWGSLAWTVRWWVPRALAGGT